MVKILSIGLSVCSEWRNFSTLKQRQSGKKVTKFSCLRWYVLLKNKTLVCSFLVNTLYDCLTRLCCYIHFALSFPLSVRNQNTFWKEKIDNMVLFLFSFKGKKGLWTKYLFPSTFVSLVTGSFFTTQKIKQILQILLQNVVLDALSSIRTILFSLIVFSKKKQWLWICDDKVFCHLADSG